MLFWDGMWVWVVKCQVGQGVRRIVSFANERINVPGLNCGSGEPLVPFHACLNVCALMHNTHTNTHNSTRTNVDTLMQHFIHITFVT